MDVGVAYHTLKKIRWPLVFFCGLLLACGPGDGVKINAIDYEEDKAVGLRFTTEMDVEKLRVFVGAESQTSVIGVIVSEANEHTFSPVLPFTPGQTYTLRTNNTEVVATFDIPERKRGEAPKVVALYPRRDTVPENLLKMYFEFAQPMQAVGNALDYITVYNESEGVSETPFLRLESELWNKEHTLLTLWLDPGRIKTDLIPNREQGLPLRQGKRYTISLDPAWKTRRGLPLQQAYTKTITVAGRDDRKPNPEDWVLTEEHTGPIASLLIDFGEPMDAFLSREAIRFYDPSGTRISGQTTLLEKDSRLRFTPDEPWPGTHIEIRVQTLLEDLAGNNLNHRFDRPLVGGESDKKDSTALYTLQYTFE